MLLMDADNPGKGNDARNDALGDALNDAPSEARNGAVNDAGSEETLRVVVSDDGQRAIVEVAAGQEGVSISEGDVEDALARAGVVYGFGDPDIRQNWRTGLVVGHHTFVGAVGKAALDGENGQITLLFTPADQKSRAVITEEGKADFYNLGLVENVTAGQMLAIRTPPTPGSDGVTVSGRVAPAKPGKSANLPLGRNVRPSEDGNAALAQIAGEVVYQGGRIHVHPVHEVAGDVDFSTGNIEFGGSVVVRGNVAAGFRIKAEGGVDIMGSVDAAEITAGGSVILRRGMQGNGKGVITATGDVVARFLEHATVRAGGDVTVSEGIIFCQVDAVGAIEVKGKKGLISGGVLRAGRRVSAKTGGSPFGARTEIEVGANPDLRRTFIEVGKALDAKKRSLEQANRSAQMLRSLQAAGRVFGEREKAMMAQLDATCRTLEAEVEELRVRRQECEDEIVAAAQGSVSFSGPVFPGVRVAVGGETFQVALELPRASFHLSDGKVVCE